MLFNSHIYLFVFLPIAVVMFAVLKRARPQALVGWIVASSFFFYGWWNPRYIPLLAGSVAANFALGRLIRRGDSVSRGWLTAGLIFNIGLIGVFKYADFAILTVNALAGTHIAARHITLPIAISFFTFIQIAYIVDVYRAKTAAYGLADYCAFVTFFPHLIAGPLVRHDEIIPQFKSSNPLLGVRAEDLSVGISLLVMGLFKKVVLADSVSPIANAVFGFAGAGHTPGFFEAWAGALAFTFQIYFDFSGYSDMAIGAARMFGVRFPINFDSPYRSANIIEFWRRWHVSLSNFLRDYVYISLGGNRKGKSRRYINLMLTMLIGGLWHGAGWNFVAWGGLHGAYLAVNHAWLDLRGKRPGDAGARGIARAASVVATFLAVVVAWVFFRSNNLHQAVFMLKGMAGLGGGFNPAAAFPNLAGAMPSLVKTALLLGMMQVVVWFLPDSLEIMNDYEPAQHYTPRAGSRLRWKPTLWWGLALCGVFVVCVLLLAHPTEFIYFQF